MKLFYDLHIHTALSPCGDNDMSPMNIINMSIIKGLDVIAITDHNSVKNCIPCLEAAKGNDIIVIPGMEIQTKEEVHLICLFRNIESALQFGEIVDKLIPDVPNKPDFFGEQLVFDVDGNTACKESRLLVSSVNMSIDKVFSTVSELNGVVIPAHVDKRNFSVISNLGFVPFNLDIKIIEFSKKCNREDFISKNKYLEKYKIIVNSDAHYLGDISEPVNYMEVDAKDIDSVFNFLK
ncbi:PHP domain-containing protein [Wukongibacter baidiensis]|uniref:PHP domain-containing protein n=1 Tax=Wukongibacter baidiensis TaxID=1723361 RepID=UPI003D7FAA61